MLSDLAHIFFPNYCLSCEGALFKHEALVCTMCQAHLPFTNYESWPDNPVAKVFHGRVPLNHASAMLHFHKGERVQAMMHALKYQRQEQMGVLLGKWLGQKLKTVPNLEDVSAIIPVPMHPKKQRKRGYNQCDLIGQGIASELQAPLYQHVLHKTSNTKSQTRKARFSRWQNVEQVYALKEGKNIRGKHILLIDDVVTTGATLEACAHALRKVDGVRVSVATVAFA